MICKWCGEPVEPGKGKCGSCGRKLPPLSECGGFYNVMPEAKLAEFRAEKTEKREEAHPMERPAARMSPAPARKQSNVLPILLMVLTGVSLLALILSVISLSSTGKRLQALEDRLAAMEQPLPETDPTLPAQSSDTAIPVSTERPAESTVPGDSEPESGPGDTEPGPGAGETQEQDGGEIQPEDARNLATNGELTLTWTDSTGETRVDYRLTEEAEPNPVLSSQLSTCFRLSMAEERQVQEILETLKASNPTFQSLPWGETVRCLEITFGENHSDGENQTEILGYLLLSATPREDGAVLVSVLYMTDEGQAFFGTSNQNAVNSWTQVRDGNVQNPEPAAGYPSSSFIFDLSPLPEDQELTLTLTSTRTAANGAKLVLVMEELDPEDLLPAQDRQDGSQAPGGTGRAGEPGPGRNP